MGYTPLNALVLQTRLYSNTSQTAWLYTPSTGSLLVLCRGSYRRSTPFDGPLDSLTYIRGHLYERTRESYPLLIDTELISTFSSIRLHWITLLIAQSLLELLRETTAQRDATPQLFQDTLSHLYWLDERPQNQGPINPFFWETNYQYYLKALKYLGYGDDKKRVPTKSPYEFFTFLYNTLFEHTCVNLNILTLLRKELECLPRN